MVGGISIGPNVGRSPAQEFVYNFEMVRTFGETIIFYTPLLMAPGALALLYQNG